MKLVEMTAMAGALTTVLFGWLFWFVIGITCSYEGARRLGGNGVPRKGRWILVFGLIVTALLGVRFYIPYYFGKIGLDDFYYSDALPFVDRFATPDWGTNLNPEDREKRSLFLAKMVYDNTGKFIFYIDRSGKMKPFSPTQKDIAQRETWVVIRRETELMTEFNLSMAIIIWLSGIIVGRIGFEVGRRNSTN